MGGNNLSMSKVLKFAGCLVFDIALLVAVLKALALFSIVDPVKSVLMLLVLFTGLVVSNAAVIAPGMLFKKVGIAYSASFAILAIIYAIISNVLSILMITGSTVWYIFWQLIFLAGFLGILSALALFSKKQEENTLRVGYEQTANSSIRLQLMDIESIFTSRDSVPLATIDSFKRLKERMGYSTPFGRITDNPAVTNIENTIESNLADLKTKIQSDLSDDDFKDINNLIDDTYRLVINKESINIK